MTQLTLERPSTVHVQTTKIRFDGGTPCNVPSKGYGIGYGSYQIDRDPVVRIDHEKPMSCNAAEALTVIAALESIPTPSTTDLLILGDSKLILGIINRVSRGMKKKGKVNPNTSPIFRSSIAVLEMIVPQFRSVRTEWTPRLQSVAVFGH